MKKRRFSIIENMLVCTVFSVLPIAAFATENSSELAKKLSNPIAALISLPFQLNYDQEFGRDDEGERGTLNIQPVVPFDLNKNWNIISRTIVPLVWQEEIIPSAGSQSGIGDIVQSVFFSPKKPTDSGWIWGAGPVLLLPTGTDDLLTADKWGIGPTAVVLKQQGRWTYGALANHLWSVAGTHNRADISNTFIQPFLSYTTPKAWTFSINTESTYDWENEQWSVPINGAVTKVTKIGEQLVSVGAGVRYWAESSDGGAEGMAFKLLLTFLFPR